MARDVSRWWRKRLLALLYLFSCLTQICTASPVLRSRASSRDSIPYLEDSVPLHVPVYTICEKWADGESRSAFLKNVLQVYQN